MPRPIEVHLQTGFSGQTVTIALDGHLLADVQARTPMQLGLAYRLELEADAGQMLTIAVPERGVLGSYAIGPRDEVVTVNLDESGLLIGPASGPVGYF